MNEPMVSESELNVRLHVTLSCSVTVGLYDGKIDKDTIAAHVGNQIAAAGGEAAWAHMMINGWTIEAVTTDDDDELITNS